MSALVDTPLRLGITWAPTVASGWGLYGWNLALHAGRSLGGPPVLLAPPNLKGATQLDRFALGPALATHRLVQKLIAARGGRWPDAPFTVLHHMGSDLGSSYEPTVWGRRNLGVVFLEDTAIAPEHLAHARRYDCIVAGSSWNAELLRSRGLPDVRMVLQGVDATVFHRAPPSGLLADRFVIFSGGKLEYRKGQDLVVAAFREFRRRHSEALLVSAWYNLWPESVEEITTAGLVEGTPARLEDGQFDIEQWLARNGVPLGSAVDVGLLPNARMGAVMREADVALFPNRAEGGTNLVAMECIACGVPTILSGNTGHRDLLQWGRPLRVQGPARPTRSFRGTEGWGESSVDEILHELERVYAARDEARRVAAEASAAILELSWPTQVARFVSAIADLL